ncbi:MAG TPA: response regulator [Gemmatimonadales bacterium]|nr:response regulator [Gemmatimonadales bacterium]
MLTLRRPELFLERELAQTAGVFQLLPRLDLQQDRTSRALPNVTIMVVDDNEQSRSIAARMLRDEGYRVIEAQSGEQALDRLTGTDDVHVVLTDIAMPGGIDGLELARRVTALSPWRRVVLMSGYARIFPQLNTSAVPYPLLIKPFAADQLAHQISEVLEGMN